MHVYLWVHTHRQVNEKPIERMQLTAVLGAGQAGPFGRLFLFADYTVFSVSSHFPHPSKSYRKTRQFKPLQLILAFPDWFDILETFYFFKENFISLNSDSQLRLSVCVGVLVFLSCWRRSSRGCDCPLTHELDLGHQGSLPLLLFLK